jgi:hypothetical protein
MEFERDRSAARGGLDTPISGSIRVREEDQLERSLQLAGISPRPVADPGPLPAFTPHFRQGPSVRPRLFVLRKT